MCASRVVCVRRVYICVCVVCAGGDQVLARQSVEGGPGGGHGGSLRGGDAFFTRMSSISVLVTPSSVS